MRMGSFPPIGAQPSSARLTARSEPRTPLHATRYDFTVGAWLSRYGLPSDTSSVGFAESVAAIKRASESGSAIVPRPEIGRTLAANTTVGALAIAVRAESYDCGPDIGQGRENVTVSPPLFSASTMRWPTKLFSSSP